MLWSALLWVALKSLSRRMPTIFVSISKPIVSVTASWYLKLKRTRPCSNRRKSTIFDTAGSRNVSASSTVASSGMTG